jgi:hypothetical protein
VFVTARHILDGYRLLEVGSTEHTYIELVGAEAEEARTFLSVGGENRPVHRVENRVMPVTEGPYFHPDANVDVAVFKVEGIDERTPVVPLGSHLDDWLGRSDFVLTEAVILGYPPVPMTREPVLVGARAEVNAQVDLYDTRHVHFVLSAMPRGGFSGGVAISEYGFALGVVTRSLLPNNLPTEFGFMTVVGVEPIYNCLALHKMLPDCQSEGWDELWNSSELWFADSSAPQSEAWQGPTGLNIEADQEDLPPATRVAAAVELFDDGKRVALTFDCRDAGLRREMVSLAISELASYSLAETELENGRQRLDIRTWDQAAGLRALEAARAVTRLLAQRGYVPMIPGPPGGEDLIPPENR